MDVIHVKFFLNRRAHRSYGWRWFGGQVTALVSYGKVAWECRKVYCIERICLTSLRRSPLVRLINWFCHILVAWASSHLMLDHNVQFGHHLSFGQWWWRWSEFFVPRKKVNSNLNNKTRSILVLYGMPQTNDLIGKLRVSSRDCGPVNLCCPFRSSIKIDKNRIDSINEPLWIEFYFISQTVIHVAHMLITKIQKHSSWRQHPVE